MILTEVVDIAELTDAQDGNCIPMIEMNIPHNRKDQAIENITSCQAVGQSQEKRDHTGEQNSSKSAAFLKGRAAPAVPPADRIQHSKPKGTETGTDGCDTAEMSQPC